jgi:hypothetical protein
LFKESFLLYIVFETKMPTVENDPLIFRDQYGNPRLIYLDFHPDKQSMGDPGLLGQLYWYGGSKCDVVTNGGEEETIGVGVHEIVHDFYAHSETEHRLKENSPGFSDLRNYEKIRRLYEFGSN